MDLENKAELRKKIKSDLKNLTEIEIDLKSSELISNLQNLLAKLDVIQKNLIVGLFAPIGKEPRWTTNFLSQLRNLQSYPAIERGVMIFKKTNFEDLEKRADFKIEILGPKQQATSVKPDVVIIPGLGFGLKGERLGRGKGYYDRFLASSESIKIGVCFESQVLNNIPVEEHDIKMDYLVTDRVIVKIKEA